MTPAVSVKTLSVSFFDQRILHEVSADFPATGISVLVGRSGSGKTTFLRAINRLNEEFPGCSTSGQVSVDLGQGLQPVYPKKGPREPLLDLTELRLRVGMLFQTPNLFPVSIFRNLSLPLKLAAGYSDKELPGIIRQALESVGLWEELQSRLDMPADRLSGGQQQRLCLARVLAMRPRVLLLDEPTASLDVHAAGGIEALLRRLSEQYCIIMVSHSLGQAKRLGDRILICESGAVTGSLAAGEGPS